MLDHGLRLALGNHQDIGLFHENDTSKYQADLPVL